MRKLRNINIPVPQEMRNDVMKAAGESFCSVSAWVRKAIANRLKHDRQIEEMSRLNARVAARARRKTVCGTSDLETDS